MRTAALREAVVAGVAVRSLNPVAAGAALGHAEASSAGGLAGEALLCAGRQALEDAVVYAESGQGVGGRGLEEGGALEGGCQPGQSDDDTGGNHVFAQRPFGGGFFFFFSFFRQGSWVPC